MIYSDDWTLSFWGFLVFLRGIVLQIITCFILVILYFLRDQSISLNWLSQSVPGKLRSISGLLNVVLFSALWNMKQ